MQTIEHYIDSNLTKESARIGLNNCKVCIGFYTNQHNEKSVVHSHPYHEFILPLAGSDVVYSIAGGLYCVHVGELIYIPAEVYHSGRFNVTSHISERLVIQIDDRIWKKAKNQLEGLRFSWMQSFVILKSDVVAFWNFKGLFERMAQSIQLNSDYQDIVFQTQVVELFVLINQVIERKRPMESGNTSDLAKRAVSYLQKHYEESDLTVTKLAQEIYTSREHLSRVFKQYTMESVHSYLTNLRMQNCRRMLAEGESVLEACNESGFSNYTSFLKAFRHLYGITPSDYREDMKVKSKSITE